MSGKAAIEIKLAIVGESSVGKTSICNVMSKGSFIETTPTVGAEFYKFKYTFKDKEVSISLFDTSGEERFHSVPTSYYHKASGVIVVYDVSKEDTFTKLDYWVTSIKDNSDVKAIICVGNKTDLEHKVKSEIAKQYAQVNGMIFTETSAKNNEGIKELVDEMIATVLQNSESFDIKPNENLTIQAFDQTTPNAGYCC
ncbi:hypothetical protein EIN_267670 [Entamoeba invadens IP1]|uniref:Uncharacterized protein n=1 Tax=Entamoeba invadens IP1 TaxID=370355 RepID=A0A0A1U878_ENTIV|nr:hypothetical protein EIN_267670 [Entamoeba invadens IP1]ELP91041.1 hypothetical protein EIN_267670 [Entamoeba invadens IP1]|eukprot:XP_004257812.1 hypothetical protein EIN_267670 [Entamoeba invadens IP1]